jgi:hypothetical protein
MQMGFEPQRNFTLRSVQNVQALANSTTRPDPGFGGDFTSNGRNADPPERLGWGNDGAPLRDFPLGGHRAACSSDNEPHDRR